MKAFLVALLISIELALVFAGCPTIISKNRWGGQQARKVEPTTKPLKYVIINHTSGPSCVDEIDCSRMLVYIQNRHMNHLNYNDIGCNFIIGGDGQIYEGAGWQAAASHTPGWNKKSLLIGFIGDYEINRPSLKQLEAGKQLIECAVERGEIEQDYKLVGARTIRQTNSPGKYLFRELQSWKGFTRDP
uniref:Peptidoglycan-recognition protein 3 n=1 Tax=Holotrichia diomphalia TaxID=33394 RepID=PGRP3_HOLDI|nr:RecName: Full=Peptidoglycan-recognition protein 3; AltName: Full=Hd-PGRP-3; Flags: Precursor [Holotrichia diomphalia]BAD08318.1 peptidoglycan recognition protein-3 [Holotrichia diomphalia]